MGFFSKIKEGLSKTKKSFSEGITSVINSFTRIDEDFFEELEEILVMSDIGVETSTFLCDELRKKIKETGATDPNEIKQLLINIISETVSGDASLNLQTQPSMILIIGVNGVGKTTSIGKLSLRLKNEGKKVVLGGIC